MLVDILFTFEFYGFILRALHNQFIVGDVFHLQIIKIYSLLLLQLQIIKLYDLLLLTGQPVYGSEVGDHRATHS